jgi:hypothetical protein
LHRNFFSTTPREQWFEDLIADLIRSGAAERVGDQLLNRD